MECRSCGHSNRGQARFCEACGVPLVKVAAEAPAESAAEAGRWQRSAYTPAHLAEKILTSRSALEGERKLVTVLFCDLANSTDLARQVGAEAMHEVLNAFFELALGEVHRVEGTINQFLGDGFMALFGAPLAHEDHVRRALHCALAIRQRLADAAADPAAPLAQLRVRMGLNTGLVVVGRIGDNLRMDYTAIGDTTNIAARLQALADPGAICCGAAVQAIGDPYFEFAAMGERLMKGVSEPVPVHALLRARLQEDAAAGSGRLGIRSPLVGRDAEMAQVREVLARLRGSPAQAQGDLPTGQGGVLVVQGDPGHGKSRLLAEARRLWDAAAEQAAGADAGGSRGRWLEGRSLSFGRNLSYWPFIEILRRGFGITEDDGDPVGWRKLTQGLTPLFGERTDEVLPYIATLLAVDVPPSHQERLKYLDGPGLKRQVFLSMRQLTELLARRQPVVLVLEDWHWADASSIELAEHLLPLVGSIPLLMIFASRLQPDAAVQRVRQFAAANPGTRLADVALGGLPLAQSAQLVTNLIGGTKGAPAGLRDLILRKTEGNPFFIEEVVRALVGEGVLAPAPGGGWQLMRQVDEVQVPDTLQGLLLSRIDRLDDEAKHAIKLASVIGRSFHERVLQEIAQARSELDHCLGDLQRAELIREKQRLPDLEFIFKHALVQEVAYGSMLADNRRGIHRRVAQAIEQLFPDRLDEFASLLAHHYTCAEDWERAQAWLFKAGDQAGRMAADTEALDQLRRAEAAYLKAHGDRLDPPQRAALARKVGAALFGTGRYEAAHEQMRQALAYLGVKYPTTPGGVRRAILQYVASHTWRRWQRKLGRPTPQSLDPALATEISTIASTMAWTDYFLSKERMLLDALIELQAGETGHLAPAEARGLSALGFALMTFGARGMARRSHHRALEVAQRSGNVSAIAFAWMALAWVDFYDGDWEPMEQRMGKAGTLYRESGDLHRWASPAMGLAWAHVSRGKLHDAREAMAEAVQMGIDAADPQIMSWGLQVLGRALLYIGPLTECEAALRRGLPVARDIHSMDNLVHMQAMLVQCLVLQGRLDECPALLADSHDILQREGLVRDFDKIELLIADAVYALAVAEASNAAAQAAHAPALKMARQACALAVASARKMPLWLPAALRLQAGAAWLAGDAKAARKGWEESLAQARRQGFPVEQGLTLLVMGQRLQEPQRCSQAAQLFREAGAWVPLARAEPASPAEPAQALTAPPQPLAA